MAEFMAAPADCRICPRLADFRKTFQPKRGSTRDDYFNGPVPGFGDPDAPVVLIGLAPGLHGAHRTGRPFTGDGAGDFMYPLFHETGFSNQPDSVSREDSLRLNGLFIVNSVKCVPPQNKPTPEEFDGCRPFLARDLAFLKSARVLLALGNGAYRSLLLLLKEEGLINRLADHPFAHGSRMALRDGRWVVASYHTSRYNVQTGRMTRPMFTELLHEVRTLAGLPSCR